MRGRDAVTYFELLASPGQATVEPLGLRDLGEAHDSAGVWSHVDLVVGAGEVQLHTGRGPEESY